MFQEKVPFSKRHGYAGQPKEITIREDAPEKLRFCVLQIARDQGWKPSFLRQVVCYTLREAPDLGNWSEFPNIWEEVQNLMYRCEWFQVYDIIEKLYARILEHDSRSGGQDSAQFAAAINTLFVEEGVGWQLVEGEIVTRGAEAFEGAVRAAVAELRQDQRPTSAGQIHESLRALSRRPEPNLRGAIVHGMGALECVARDVTGDEKATLGEILKRYPDLLPKPLDEALAKVWGYASNEARHVEEGREPAREEAEMIVGLTATLVTYLTVKHRGRA